MKINIDRILEHAESRLNLKAHEDHQDWVTLFKKFLKIEHHRLLMYHRAGALGIEVAEIRSFTIDILVRHAFSLLLHENKLDHHTPLSLVALGGYGRGILNPHSDIDLMFLTTTKDKENTQILIKKLLYLLWDIGLKVGHSVRNINDTITESKRDFKTCTSIMESRFITGNHTIYKDFEIQFAKKGLEKKAYIRNKSEEIRQRHQKYRNTVYLLEPHIKEGLGGLRDYFSVLWIYQMTCGYKNYHDLEAASIISKKEHKSIQHAFEFLMRTRNELHFLTNKAFDIITLSIQPQIANNLGIKMEKVLQPSEALMKQYYTHARNIYYFSKMILERAEIYSQLKIKFPKKFVERHGFSFTADEIQPGNDLELFKKQPLKMLEVFLYCAQGNYKLSYALLNQIRENLFLVDNKFRTSSAPMQIFLNLIQYTGPIISAIRAMHESGFLGKYIPEFGHATCFVIHDLYHEFTLDEHTLRAIEILDQFKFTNDPKLQRYAQVYREIKNKDILFFSVFFHDIGKTKGKDHAKKGARMVEQILRRMQYPITKIPCISLLVEEHISMVHISQRRNLSEEKVIINFASRIGSLENLRILLLLTYADSNATSDKIWNEWKETLLWELFLKTQRYLKEKVPFLISEIIQRENLYIKDLIRAGINSGEASNHIKMLPFTYIQAFEPEIVAKHIRIIQNIKKHDPILLWHYNEQKNTTELTVFTKDQIGIFSKISGTLTGHLVNILSAEIFTRGDGMIIDRFSLENTGEKEILDERIQKRIEKDLQLALQKKHAIHDLLKEKIKTINHKYKDPSIPKIRFDNETSPNATIVEIQANDEIGLLYKISKTLMQLDLNIFHSKIATEKAQVFDVFYLKDQSGKKIFSTKELNNIKDTLEKSINLSLEDFMVIFPH